MFKKPMYAAPRSFAATIAALTMLLSAACEGDSEDAEGRQLPSDRQVIEDVTPNDAENVVGVQVVAGNSGESYLHRDNLVWTFDRGVVIKRKAQLADLPDAVVVVGGLARYQLVGDYYVYRQFLTTYNEYEGVPAPAPKELVRFVEQNLGKVFAGREHNILAVDTVELAEDKRWIWHTPNSFTASFSLKFRERQSYTTIEDRVDTFDIRFYRESPDKPMQNLLATETARELVATQELDANAIDDMPSLRINFGETRD